MPKDIAELVDLYAENSTLPRHVIAAFVSVDQEPPSGERVDQQGYSAAERDVIGSYYDKHDPHGARIDA